MMRLWQGTKICCLAIITILLVSSFTYLKVLSYRPKREVSYSSSTELRTAVDISFHGHVQGKELSSRRNLLASTHVHRYILGLNYWEQLTMAMRNFLLLACLGNEWNMSAVQPFTYNSRLYGLPNFKPDDNVDTTRSANDLGLIFNTDSINDALRSNNLQSMTPFQEFLINSQRQLTVIHYIPSKEIHELPVMKGDRGKALAAKLKYSNIVDCNYILADYKERILANLNDEVRKLSFNSPSPYPDFKIVKYLCVNMSVLFTPQELFRAIKVGNPDQNESVIVVNWRGTAAQPVFKNTAKGTHLNKRIAMTSSCRMKKLATDILVEHSQQVLSATQTFLKDEQLSESGYIAVHIRSEKMGVREPRFPGSTKRCLNNLSASITNLLAHETNLPLIYITDFGPYSSDTCKNCQSGIKVEKWLSRKHVEKLQFDPIKYSLPPDSGFAAAVESNVLASARYLIICGGGSFQSQVVNRFIEKHRSTHSRRRIIKVCTEDSDLTLT